MYRRDDPRFRRTLNQVTSTFETSAETAQLGLFSLNEHYLKPCLGSLYESLQPCLQSFEPCLSTCASTLDPCTETCFPRTADARGRPRARTRARLEHSFDFYDDWAEDENDALLALDDDEFDRVVGHEEADAQHEQYLDDPSVARSQQPGRRKVFDYGAAAAGGTRARRSTIVLPTAQDPNLIPNQSRFGFLSRLPFGMGQRAGLRYKPSAADLQVRSKSGEFRGADVRNGEGAGLIEEDEEEADAGTWRGHGRTRSATTGSAQTTDSFSSRGDLFPSDEEGDAVPLDDEFTLPLDRQRSVDEASSGKTGGSGGKRPSLSKRKSTKRKISSKSPKSDSSTPGSEISDPEMGQLPTLNDLKLEEQKAREAEDEDVERKRGAAQKLAAEMGLEEDEGAAKPKLVVSTSEITSESELPSAEPYGSVSAAESELPTQKLRESPSRDGG